MVVKTEIFRYSVWILSCIIFLGCPLEYPDLPVDSNIKIINNSKEDIVYSFNFSYPDTTINFWHSTDKLHGIIRKGLYRDNKDAWIAGFFREPKSKVILFLFSKDTIDQVPWEKIRAEYKILKRYDLGLKELDSLNWTIEYK